MLSLFRKGIAAIAVVGSVGLVAAETFQNIPAVGERLASDSAEDTADETTGSVGAISANRGSLSLTDEQRERIYQGVMRFADAVRRDARVPELADKLPSDEPLQDLPASVTGEIPLLHAHKFVKLDDRILLIDPASRVVVAMIPRYKLLP
jgi:hypothetical protein